MITVLGWSGVVLLFVLGTHYVLRKLAKSSLTYHGTFKQLSKLSKKIHPFIGILLLAIGLLHGNMALGRLVLHTGTILWSSVLVMFLLIVLFKSLKKGIFLKMHRVFAVVTFLLLGLHLFARNIV